MKRAVRVSVYFDTNYAIEYKLNTDDIFQSPKKIIRFTTPQIEATQIYIKPEIRGFTIIPKCLCHNLKEMVCYSILENPEEFGRKLVEIVETYRETYGVDDPQYSIGCCEYDIER